jgi:hypothetical protein
MLCMKRGPVVKRRQAGQGRPEAARRESLDEPGTGRGHDEVREAWKASL